MKKELLKNKNYMLVVVGNFISLMGSNLQQFVLALYVLDQTGSSTLFASMLAVSILPRIIFSPLAGVFGDWFDKKKSIVVLDLVNVFVLTVFAIYLFSAEELSLGLVFVLVLLLETTEVFFRASISVILPMVVKKEQYLEANSFRSMLTAFAQILAPMIGVLVYGIWGLLAAIIVNAVSFFFSAISEMFIQIQEPLTKETKKSFQAFKKDFISGLKIVKQSKAIRLILVIAVIVNFSISPFFSVGLIFLVREVMGRGDFEIGLLQVVISSSMIAVPLLLTNKLKKAKFSSVFNIGFVVMGILIMMVALSLNSWMLNLFRGFISYVYVLVLCFVIGVMVSCINIVSTTFFQKAVPIEYMGRLSTILGLFTTVSIPIGQMIFGYLYDTINLSLVFLTNGIMVFSVVLVFYTKMHQLDIDDSENANQNRLEGSVVANDYTV